MDVIDVAGKLLGLGVADLGAGESGSEDEDACWSRADSAASYEGVGSDDEHSANGKRKRMSAEDRKARNRERNRLHARKTRQRKKQHVQELQLKIWGLRQERQRLLQLSTEHHTAGVLLALSCSPNRCIQGRVGGASDSSTRTPQAVAPVPGRDWNRELALHEETLHKITKEFESMDGGQHAGEEGCGGVLDDSSTGRRSVGGSIGKGGDSSRGAASRGTLADRTALRRERNRMHAKRTRNRKKLFVEACSVMIDKMKVENAQLKAEIRASGIHLPEAPNNPAAGQDMVPEEPLPEYLAALLEFAEGKAQSPCAASSAASAALTVPRAPKSPSVFSRQSSASSLTVSSSRCVDTNAPVPPALEPKSNAPGQALEDAGKLCAFMEAAQSRSAKRIRVVGQDGSDSSITGARARIWSDHGSTTSESRGSSESGDEISTCGQREAADAALLLASRGARKNDDGSLSSPAFWTSRQVLERYVLPRQVC